MGFRKWEKLPPCMRTEEVRKYYNIIGKRRLYLVIKRLLDILVATVMLLVLAIPMLVIAVLIRLDSPGPVLFRQKRVTQYGRVFSICKFRTMTDHADRQGTQVTVNGDARITRIGAKLRHLRVDEFPQIFNVLAGDMTLVGTRPEVESYVSAYTPEMYATLLLPAGLTSRASIAYKDEERLLQDAADADRTYIEQVLPGKMKYNLESLQHFGILSDMSVLWDTFTAVIGR